jgi:hypothetical protein
MMSGRMKSLYLGASLAPRTEQAASQIQDSRDLFSGSALWGAQSYGLTHQPAQFFEHRRGSVCLVMFLVANRIDREKPGGCHAGERPVHRAGAGAHEADEFVALELPLRLAIKQCEESLLHWREQHIRNR